MAINFIKKEDLSHITRTTRQWETTIDRYEIIPKGVLCIELCNDKLTKIKIGNGHLIYEQLPYVSDVNLSDYYTKEETNNLIKDLKAIKIKGEASSLSDLPLRGNEEGDLWFIPKSDPDEHNRYDEYVWYKNKWESFGSSDIDLSEYAKKSYVDTHIQEVQDEITEIIESGYLHKHNNKDILDQTSAVYNVEKDNKLRDLHNYDDTELREKAHTHLNKNILDQTDAVYNRDKDDKLSSLHNYDDTDVKDRISTLEGVAHSHSNQDILNRTTAAFTREQALQLLDCKDFEGTDGVHDGYHGFVPAPTASDAGKVLGANGQWVEGGSTGGDVIAQGGGIEITTDSQTGVKTVSVNAGTGLDIDSQTGELYVTSTGGDSIAEGNGIDITTDSQTGVKTISVDIGDGLQFNQNSEIDINTGDGLSINQNNELEVSLGNGLQFDSNNEIEINTGDGLSINNDNELELDKATKNSIGGVIVGDNIDVSNGTISVPIATDSSLGVVKPTDGLSIDNTGELSVNTGDGLSINQDNELEVNVGDGLTVDVNNNLKAKIGTGLHFNENNAIEADEIDIDTYEPGNAISFTRHYARELPTGYTQLDYIESHFDAGFIMDYYPQKTSKIVCEVAYVDVNRSSPNDNCLFGSRNGSGSGNKQFCFWFNNRSNDPCYVGFVYSGDVWSDSTIKSSTYAGMYQRLLFEISPSIGVYCNSVRIQNPLTHPEYDPSPYKLGILCLALSDTTIDTSRNYQSGRIYTFKIYESDTLVVDLVPCLNDSDVPGLYDMVNEVFYASASGTDFTYDPDTVVTHDSITIDANRGAGIIYENNALALNPGFGLSVDANDDQKLNVNLADGLSIKNTSTNAIKINTGDGLSVDSTTNNLNVNIGDGLVKDSSNNIDVNVYDNDLYINSENNQIRINPLYAPTYDAGNGIQFVSTTPSVLPTGYTRLTYIESKGASTDRSASILEYVPTKDTKIDMTFEFTKGMSELAVIGSQTTSNLTTGSHYHLNLGFNTSNKKATAKLLYGQNGSQTVDQFITDLYTPINVVASKDGVFVDGIQVQTVVATDETMPPYKMRIFTLGSGNDTGYGSAVPIRIHEVKLYEGNVLSAHLIPCLNPNNVPGMYDVVNDVFYQSTWTTAYHYDENDKSRPGYYVQAKLGNGLQFDANGAIEVVNGGTEYTAGDGIDINSSDEISVKIGNHLSFDQTTGDINVDDIIEYHGGAATEVVNSAEFTIDKIRWTVSAIRSNSGSEIWVQLRYFGFYDDSYNRFPVSSGVSTWSDGSTVEYYQDRTIESLIANTERLCAKTWNGVRTFTMTFNLTSDISSDDLKYFRYYTGDDESGRDPVSWTIEVHDKVADTWIQVQTVTDATVPTGRNQWTSYFNLNLPPSDGKKINVLVGDGLSIDSTNNDINVKTGRALSINSSTKAVDVDIASDSSYGCVKIGEGIDVDQYGIISVDKMVPFRAGNGLELVDESVRLPSAYARVEYVENTVGGGWALINSLVPSYVGTSSDKSHIIARLSKTAYSSSSTITYAFGRWDNYNARVKFAFGYHGTSLPLTVGYVYGRDASWNNVDVNGGRATNYELNDIIDVDLSAAGLKIDNELIHTVSYEGPGAISLKFGVFRPNISGTPESGGVADFRGRIYSLKLYDDQVLIFNLVPCVQKSSSIVGFYDSVGDTFYPSVGDNPFETDMSTMDIDVADWVMNVTPATTDTIGGIKVGSGLSATNDGTLSVNTGEGLFIDSTNNDVNVKIGQALSINNSNEIDVNLGQALSINNDNEIDVDIATATSLGVVKAGSGLNIDEFGNLSTQAAPFRIGRALSLDDESVRLPSAYMKAKYVQSDGDARCYTGFFPGNYPNAKYVGAAAVIGDTNGYKYIFGTQGDNYNSSWSMILSTSYDNQSIITGLTYNNNNDKVNNPITTAFAKGDMINFEASMTSGLKLNNELVQSLSTTFTKSTDEMFIFSERAGYTTKARLYSFKIYNSDDTLLANFVPAVRKSDNEVGFYETVSNQFINSNYYGPPFTTDMDDLDVDDPDWVLNADIATSNSLGVVKPSTGLVVNEHGALSVNTGDGLTVNQNNELEVSLGGGLQFDQNGAVEVPVMGASGTNHSSGLVPDPGSTEGTSRFLREDGSWEEPSIYELPIAGPAVLGGIKIGDGIDINSNGVASVNKMDPFRVGRGLTMEDESERLPTGYYKAKYIESDGSAYTTIPFTPASYPNAKVIGKAMVTGVKPQYNQGYLFGTTKANNWTGQFNFILSTKTTSADSAIVSRFYYGDMYGPPDNPPFETGYSIGDILEFEMSASDGLKIDNETIHSISSSMSGLSTPYSFAIFGLGSASGTGYMSKARIYSLKIYNGDTLLVNLVPAYRQSDEKVGFYNTVNSTFYVSSNNDHPFTTDLTDLDPGDPDWVLKANIATDSSIGEVIVGDGLSVANDGTVSVHIGSGLEINQTTGAIDATAQPLEPATANTIGGVIVGNGLTVTSDGTISTVTGKAYIAGEGINMSSSQYEFSAENEQYLFRSQVTCELHGSFNREFQKYSDDTALGIIWNVYDSGTLWSGPLFVGLSADAVKYTTNSTTYSALGTFSYLGKSWYYSDTQMYVSNIDGTDYDGNMVVDTETYASTSDIVQACKSLIDRSRVILKVDEISLLPATEDTLGGIKIGEGLSIDENNVVSSTVYEEGQGITFETSGSTDSFDVKNKEYYFDDIISCQLNGDYGPRTFTRVSTDPCLLAIVQTTANGVIWSGPLAVGLTENSAKYSNSYDGTTIGPDTSFEYKGYTWYLTFNYGLMNSTGVDLMGNVPSIDMKSIDISDRNDLYLLGQALIDTAELITEVNPYEVWDSSTWLNGAYGDSQSDQFWTNWYYTYHSKQDEYFELPEWATKMRLIGISNENDSRLQGGGVDCFDSSHHHFTSVGCITDEWADIPEGTVYVQFGVKWNELNDRTISSSDIKSVTFELFRPLQNNAITAKLGDGLTFDENDAITLDESIKLIIHCVGTPLT